jgi:hypothetical protein
MLLAAAAIFLLAFADALGFFRRPPLWLEMNGTAATVHVERLGEYVTAVGHVRLKEASSGKVIYEIVGKDRAPEISNFHLKVGENSSQVVDPEGAPIASSSLAEGMPSPSSQE